MAAKSAVELLDAIIGAAHARRASDIHLSPVAEGMRVRLRVDGVLEDAALWPAHLRGEVVSRLKVLASLRTDEHISPQDGRFRAHIDEIPLDVRLSVVPTYWGENVVLRLLRDRSREQSLADLGFSPSDREKIESAIAKKSGMVLATGPTGSGKTTTLYTLLKLLNAPGISMVTIEDPVEYAIAGVTQVQVNARAGLTFGSGLRSLLRQDPDIIMVGEIRDSETAAIAANTALTGHLLLSSFHTSDAATTLTRLRDMGVDAYVIASTIHLAIGQRLVRRLCAECKEPVAGEKRCRARGCSTCNGTGFAGRLCISEVLVANDDIRAAVMRNASAKELRDIAVKAGMTTMQDDGREKVARGETTLEEVHRVMHT